MLLEQVRKTGSIVYQSPANRTVYLKNSCANANLLGRHVYMSLLFHTIHRHCIHQVNISHNTQTLYTSSQHFTQYTDSVYIKSTFHTIHRLCIHQVNISHNTQTLYTSSQHFSYIEVFYYQLMHKRTACKGVLKFTLKLQKLQHVSWASGGAVA